MSNYQNVDTGGESDDQEEFDDVHLEVRQDEIQKMLTCGKLSKPLYDRLEIFTAPQPKFEQSWQIPPAGNQKGATNTISSNVPHDKQSKKGQLEKHVRVYDGQQLVSCHFCDKIITQSSNIEKHERRMQTQDLPHKCKNCEVKLANATTIINHSSDMNGAENPKECKDCDKICHKGDTLKGHVSTHRSVEKYECTICVQTFTRMNPKSYEHEETLRQM